MRPASLVRAVVVMATAATLIAGGVAHAQSGARAAAVAGTELSTALEATARAVAPSVVEIVTTAFVAGDGTGPRATDLVTTERGSGSGVIVDSSGYIVTNAHVVKGAQRLQVEIPTPHDGRSILAPRSRRLAGEVVGVDTETDLAVVKVAATGLPALPIGDSDALRTGQLVMAFGSPMGLQNTVSFGVVSAVARQLDADSPMIYVQTDASIGAGSSGGPLVDLQGRVMGINTLMLSRSGGYEGLGFAVPGNIVATVYAQLRAHGRVKRGDIGVRAQTITPELAVGLGLPRERGVVIADVLPRSPAARAGLVVGDIVLALDGKPMENGRQLQVGLYRRVVGDVAQLQVLRDGAAVTLPVAMTERPDAIAGLTADPRQHLVAPLGILAMPLDPRTAGLLPGLRSSAGVVVVSSAPGAIDSRAGRLLPGDVIRGVNRSPVATLEALRAALQGAGTGTAVVLHLERGGELMYLAFLAE